MKLEYQTLDVFTRTALTGNPVAIVSVPLDEPLTQDQKQRIAQEFNLSETVILNAQTPEEAQHQIHRIDIFTSYAEVPFAGHPTIGTANHLLERFPLLTSLTLQCKAGPIAVERTKNGAREQIPHSVHIHNSPFADKAYGSYPVVSIVKGMTFILAKLANLQELKDKTENLVGTGNTYKMQHLLDENWRDGIVVSYFYVDLGIDSETGERLLRTRSLGSREDPATGSAASALSSYLSLSEEGEVTRQFHITQGVEMGRESHIRVEVELSASANQIDRVFLSGSAIKVMQGIIEF
jgi:PhzF family phenazine biosynthesis protein